MSNYILKAPTIQNFDMKYYLENCDEIIENHLFPPHIHDELEVYVLIEGDVSFMVERKIYKLTAGDVVISKPNEVHNCILNSATVHKHYCFWFDVSCDFLFKPYTESEFGEGNLISLDKDGKAEILSLCSKIHNATLTKDIQGEFIYASQLIYLLSKKTHSNKPAIVPNHFQKILDYVNANFININTIDDLTKRFFISRSTLCRLFSTYLRTSPKNYIETKRLAHSRKLLKEGKTVFNACIDSGFPDYSNYIRLFKKRFGITPKQYQSSDD